MLARSTLQQRILCIIPFFAAMGILPFAIFRFIQQDWIVAILDFTFFILMSLIGYFAYQRKHVETFKIFFCVLAILGTFFTIYMKGVNQLFWCYPTIVILFYFLVVRVALISTLVFVVGVAVLSFSLLTNLSFISFVITLVITSACSFAFSYETNKQHVQLELLSKTDSLTKVFNRRAFKEVAEKKINEYLREPKSASLILLDLDYFKQINDEFGHNKGDEVLIKICRLIEDLLRKSDYLFRVGGEEFVILPDGTNLQQTINLANRIKDTVEAFNFIENHTVTISCGLAEYNNTNDSLKDWYAHADKALYNAKVTRNTVCYDTGSTDADHSANQSRATK